MSYIIIGADIVPTVTNEHLFTSKNISELLGEELLQLLKGASYRIFNLEVPLTECENPIKKCGPNLRASVQTVNGLSALKINLLTLANNHIMDQGNEGLLDTLNILDSNGIGHVGAGKNLKHAIQPYIFDFSGKKVGVYACCEHEFSIASDNIPGANPYDPLWSYDHISELKKQCDYVIVLYHGGKEHYRYPSPNSQRVCRRFVDKGADLVLCQHSHSIGCEEKYNDRVIVYGQGNFIFDNSKEECWKTGLLILVKDDLSIEYVPIEKKENKVRLADMDNTKAILQGFAERSEEIKKPGEIERLFSILSKQYAVTYFYTLHGKEKIIFRILNRLSGNVLFERKMRRIYAEKYLLALKNYLECESHRELFNEAINNMLWKS